MDDTRPGETRQGETRLGGREGEAATGLNEGTEARMAGGEKYNEETLAKSITGRIRKEYWSILSRYFITNLMENVCKCSTS